MYFSANSPGGDYLLRRHQLFTRLGKPTGFQHLLSQIIVVVIGDNCVLLLLFSYRLVAGNDFYYGDTNPSQVFSNSSLWRSSFLLLLLLLVLVGFGDLLSAFYYLINRERQQVFSTSSLSRSLFFFWLWLDFVYDILLFVGLLSIHIINRIHLFEVEGHPLCWTQLFRNWRSNHNHHHYNLHLQYLFRQ